MNKTPMILFMIFGVLMILIGQYRRMHEQGQMMDRMMRGDPLVNAINAYNKKNDEQKSALSGLMSKTTNATKSRGSADPRKPTNNETEVADDAFSEEPRQPVEAEKTEKMIDLKYYKPGKLPTASDPYPGKTPKSTPAPGSGFYPPAATQSQSTATGAPAAATTYYPPVPAGNSTMR